MYECMCFCVYMCLYLILFYNSSLDVCLLMRDRKILVGAEVGKISEEMGKGKP